MNELIISSDWMDEERLTIVVRIATALKLPKNHKSTEYVLDCAERLRFLATMPASFLEANRDAIINGSPAVRGGGDE